jgi:hypothetical protein
MAYAYWCRTVQAVPAVYTLLVKLQDMVLAAGLSKKSLTCI